MQITNQLWILLVFTLIGVNHLVAATSDDRIVYQEINKHLNEVVKNSHEPLTNLAKLKEWWSELTNKLPTEIERRRRNYYNSGIPRYVTVGAINSQSSFDILNTTITYLGLMEFYVEKGIRSEVVRQILKYQNSFLGEARTNESNSPYGRLDRIFEHFALEWVDEGRALGESRPELRHIFKTSIYDEINEYLVKNVDSDDVETNFAKVNERLDTLVRDQVEEGVLTDALRLLVALKSVVDEKMCNSKGYDIIFKNDLATAGTAHTNKLPPIRRIDKLVNYYSKKHAKICPPVYKQKFGKLIQKFDNTSLKQLLTLTDSYILSDAKYMIKDNNINISYVDETKFYTPSLENFLDNLAESKILDKFGIKSVNVTEFGAKEIRQYLEMVAAKDPDVIYLEQVPNEITGDYEVRGHELDGLINKYFKISCENYVKSVGKDIYRLLQHDELVYDSSTMTKNDLKNNPSFYIGRLTYELCNHITHNSQLLFVDFINSVPSKPGRSSIKDMEI